MRQCPKCASLNPDQTTNCVNCGSSLLGGSTTMATEGDGIGGLIPYKNPQALLAYYLGIFSGLPLIGLPIGIAAFVLGILGLRARQRNPIIKGSVHAGIGIGCGCFFTLLWSVVLVAIIVGILSSSRRT